MVPEIRGIAKAKRTSVRESSGSREDSVPQEASAEKQFRRLASRRNESSGGGGGIRTLVTRITGKTVFETAAFNHSATPPRGVKSGVKPRSYENAAKVVGPLQRG